MINDLVIIKPRSSSTVAPHRALELLIIQNVHAAKSSDTYSAFANSCPMQIDTFLFPLIQSHNVILSSNKF